MYMDPNADFGKHSLCFVLQKRINERCRKRKVYITFHPESIFTSYIIRTRLLDYVVPRVGNDNLTLCLILSVFVWLNARTCTCSKITNKQKAKQNKANTSFTFDHFCRIF